MRVRDLLDSDDLQESTERREGPRPIHVIAHEIAQDWTPRGKGVYFGAVPYLNAMYSLGDIDEAYGYDTGRSVVLYFLSNATTWRGDVARRVKAELKALVK